MRFLILHYWVLIALISVGGTGCSKRPQQIEPENGSRKRNGDAVGTACQLIKNAQNLTNYRDALDQVNIHLNKSPTDPFASLTSANRKTLADEFSLTANEVEFVANPRYQPLDAAHLSNRLFIRDVAQSLRIVDSSPVEQAGVVCGWVAQQVVLQEPAERWYPPRWALMAGEGNTAERAMLTIQLLQQLGIESCALKAPTDSTGPILVGILSAKKIYVFDPKLGVAVAGPDGKGVATLDFVHAQPQLVAKHGIEAKQATVLHPALVCSLPALSPRMHYLQKALQDHDDIVVLTNPPEAAIKKWRSASKQTFVWNAKTGDSPIRALSRFFPEKENPSRHHATHNTFLARQLPLGMIEIRMRKLGLLTDMIADDKADPKERLRQWAVGLYHNYAMAPRLLSFRGQYDSMNKRINIIRKVISNIDFAPLSRTELDEEILKWKKRVNDAYLAWARNAKAVQLVNQIWGEDLFLHGMLRTPEDAVFLKYQKKLLTYMLLEIVRPEIEKDAQWLTAQHWHSKAVRQHKSQRANSEWSAAQRWWQKYLASYDMSPSVVNNRVAGFAPSVGAAFEQWNSLVTDLTRAVHAKCLLAEAYDREGERELAQKQWRQTEKEIAALLGDETLRNKLTEFIDTAKQSASTNVVLSTTLNRLKNLLDPNGSLAHLLRRAAFHVTE